MKIRATQFIPDGPQPLFQIIDDTSARVGWHIKLRDAISGDEPEFLVPRSTGSKKTLRLVTLDEVCRAGFRECNEGRGILTLTEWRQGLPVYVARVACWPGWTGRMERGRGAAVPIFKPLWSTDPERTARELPWHEPPARFVNSQWGLAGR